MALTKYLFNAGAKPWSLDIGLLLLRSGSALAMGLIGYNKLVDFREMSADPFWAQDINFMNLGGPVSLGLTIFAEFFCCLFIFLGLGTRIFLVPLIFCMGYIVFVLDKGEVVSSGENGYDLNHAFFYGVIFLAQLFTGPGRFSLDKLISK